MELAGLQGKLRLLVYPSQGSSEMRAVPLLCALCGAFGCTSLELSVPEEKIALPDLGPLPALPAAPTLAFAPAGELVCTTADEALALAEHLSVTLPAWRDSANARYRFYRSHALRLDEVSDEQVGAGVSTGSTAEP